MTRTPTLLCSLILAAAAAALGAPAAASAAYVTAGDVAVRTYAGSPWSKGTLFRGQGFQVGHTDGAWAWGRAGGEAERCGWVLASAFNSTTKKTDTTCGAPQTQPLDDDEHVAGGGPSQRWYVICQSARLFGNYRGPGDLRSQSGDLSLGDAVGWRYTVKGGYAASVDGPTGSPRFILRSCIDRNPPQQLFQPPPVPCPSPKRPGREHKWVLQPHYCIKTEEEGFDPSNCVVYENASHQGGSWPVAPGQLVKWRYNWGDPDPGDSTKAVSVIIDPQHPGPHWGFIRRDCIGLSTGDDPPKGQPASHGWPENIGVPSFLMRYRSQTPPRWKPVSYHKKPSMNKANRTIQTKVLFRDNHTGVGLGTLLCGWRVYRTDNVKRGYVKVFSPTLRLWGWVPLKERLISRASPHC